jgi:uncharacterized protein (DUF58 family)
VVNPPEFSMRDFPGWGAGFWSALERLTIAPRRPARSQQAGEARSRARGRALEFADYRSYTPGDDPRLVDWRAYARLDRLYLKQYEEDRARTLTLIVDVSASLDWGDGEEHKGLFARRLAAALAWIALNRHEMVRAFLVRDGGIDRLPPASSRGSAAALFQRLAEAREAGKTGLAKSLRSALQSANSGPVVLLSDLLDPAWEEALAVLAACGEGIVLQVLAPAEWEPPLGEEVELEDAETGDLRATRLAPAEIADYRRRLDEFLTSVRQRCAQLDLAHVALNTGSRLQDVVLRDLPAAGILG